MNSYPIRILLVEDNEGDIVLTTEALADGKISNEIEIVRDGDLAISFLEERLETPSLLPDLVLLDINLPKKNGYEVLIHAKNNDRLKHIPIVILTTSSAHLDMLRSYQEHANYYMVKPIDIADLLTIISKIENFWITLVRQTKTK